MRYGMIGLGVALALGDGAQPVGGPGGGGRFRRYPITQKWYNIFGD
jgi:hypothetical protein